MSILCSCPFPLSFSENQEYEEQAGKTKGQHRACDEGVLDPGGLEPRGNGVSHGEAHGVSNQCHGDHSFSEEL